MLKPSKNWLNISIIRIIKAVYDQSFLIKMVLQKMPFGQYKGRYITGLPVHYLEWFARKGFPDGQLGQHLSTMYEIKINGLEHVLKPIIAQYRTDS